jgi:hypothetical protein
MGEKMHDSEPPRNTGDDEQIAKLTLRIPRTLAERIRVVADSERRSVNGQIERWLEEALAGQSGACARIRA